MTDNSVCRARIDERTKRQAAAALKKIGLTLSDAFRLLLVRVASEKALAFEPLNPNAETVAAMKVARRGESRGRQARLSALPHLHLAVLKETQGLRYRYKGFGQAQERN